MAVERKDVLMHLTGLGKGAGFVHQPSEEGYHAGVTLKNKAFGMPLYAQNTLVASALHSLCHSVISCGTRAQQGAKGSDSLMVERVDGYPFLPLHDVLEQAALRYLHMM